MASSSKFISFYFVPILLLTIFSPSTVICQTNPDAGIRIETSAPSISGRLYYNENDGIIYIYFYNSHTNKAIAAGNFLVVPKENLPSELSIELYDKDPLTRAVYEIYDALKKCQEAKDPAEKQRACALVKLKIFQETDIWSTTLLENNPLKPDWVKEVNEEAKREIEKFMEGYSEVVRRDTYKDPTIEPDKYILDYLPASDYIPK